MHTRSSSCTWSTPNKILDLKIKNYISVAFADLTSMPVDKCAYRGFEEATEHSS